MERTSRLAVERADTWFNAYSRLSIHYAENGSFQTWDKYSASLFSRLPRSDPQVNSESYNCNMRRQPRVSLCRLEGEETDVTRDVTRQ